MSKNLHINHIEDEPFINGYAGALGALQFIEQIASLLGGAASKNSYNVTTKYDGAPAVIFGISPITGHFFVGTKSVFNKSEAKINHTEIDIDRNHGDVPGLVIKLKEALKYLKDICPDTGVFQGDFLFSHNDLTTENIDGEQHTVFRPNTISYAVPKASDLGKTIDSVKLGLVVHTRYTGETFSNMSAEFNVKRAEFKPSNHVWLIDPAIESLGKHDVTNAKTNKQLESIISSIHKTLSQLSRTFVNEIAANENLSASLLKFTNYLVREGKSIPSAVAHAEEYIAFNNKEREKAFNNYKTEKKKAEITQIKQYELDWLTTNKNQLVLLFTLQKLLQEAKLLLLESLNKISSLKGFAKDSTGFKYIGAEGFVAVDKDNKTVKLIDRMSFSRLNFTMPKNWGEAGPAPTVASTQIKEKKVVFGVGRFQPPTAGHQLLIDLIKSNADRIQADHYVFTFPTNDPKKNPLTIKDKLKFLRLANPKIEFNGDQKNPFDVIAWLNKQKYTHVYFIAGQDRVMDYQTMVNKMLTNKTVDFISIEVISAGTRDADDEMSVAGVSATKQRDHAKNGRKDQFMRNCMSRLSAEDKEDLYNTLRKSMGIKDE